MNLDYEKLKFKHTSKEGEQWASYSDLFMVLSIIFLLLYVVASVRSGTLALQDKAIAQKVKKENEKLKAKVQVYESIKDDFLDEEASVKEQKKYQALMRKVSLVVLEQEQKEKDLAQKYFLQKQKNRELNSYQQELATLINQNALLKASLLEKKDQLNFSKLELKELETELRDQVQIREKQAKALKFSQTLIRERKIENKDLKQNIQDHVAKDVEKVETIAAKRILELSQKHSNQLANLQAENRKLSAQIEDIKKKYGDRLLLKKFQVGSLKKKLSSSLAKMENSGAKKMAIAQIIEQSFKDKGVPVDINEKTGDIILSFDNEYFDNGKAILKPGMKETLNRFIPLYAQTLLGNKEVRDEISGIEIMGFASPTYNKRYVDPTSLDPKYKEAVNYNLDLSYQRAKSIFNYVFDTRRMKYPYQRDLRSLIKVTGRSFVTEKKAGRSIASGTSWVKFCQKYNCEKSQRVIIRFEVND